MTERTPNYPARWQLAALEYLSMGLVTTVNHAVYEAMVRWAPGLT